MTGVTVADVVAALDEFAPPALAESWDNIGLLLGEGNSYIESILTCLTLTPDVAEEAIATKAELIVTHHPILFRPVQKLTAHTTEGAMILKLIRAGVAVYSPHTAFDSTVGGINEHLARRLNLAEIAPLRPVVEQELTPVGAGRIGTRPQAQSFAEFARELKATFALPVLQAVPVSRPILRVAVGCGSAAEFLTDAVRAGCDCFVTGEARFHSALEARSLNIGLILLGHYTSERFAVESLAKKLSGQFPTVTTRPSTVECDPLEWL